MIIFHEGMPRSGKSYAATADHIVPALKSGRRLYVRIDGIDHDKLAYLASITLDRCCELLTILTEEDVQKLDQVEIENDSLVVIDELQNFFPNQRAPLSVGMTKWIAEHGHHGLDVLCMGQLLKDCHRTWINRTNRKIQFIKKDMLGKPDEYKWRMFTGSPDARGTVKFVEVQKGDGKYDEKFFGCYKSHSEGTENKGTYEDERANIFKSPMFRRWLPLMGIVMLVAVGWLIHIFNGGLVKAPEATAKPVKVVETRIDNARSVNPVERHYVDGREYVPADQVQTPVQPKQNSEVKTKEEAQFPDIVTDLSKTHRIRLAGVFRTAVRTRVLIEWRDTSYRVIQQLDSDDLEALGWHVAAMNNNRMVMLLSPAGRQVATAWPVDDQIGKIPEDQNDRVRREGRQVAAYDPVPAYYSAPDERPLPETAPVSTRDAVPYKRTKFTY
ncbi:zonular occludens toxin domain-containing protein [Azonexus sp.]|jgi:zona occludens toxin|uniref:zonular occludens toxin domain-containing protein n=1 Tax=Azonexus sp. TaxID=1872668 RepID=UPI00283388E6|nr:zonular occludens toxin domain-containing protein [Azonexus sp.]MDR1996481.1 zonular occludens toxin domain-containing protein [Azonexus sp.]